MFINKILKECNRFRLSSFQDKIVKDHFPNATRDYYSNMSDMILAGEHRKIDGYEGIR